MSQPGDLSSSVRSRSGVEGENIEPAVITQTLSDCVVDVLQPNEVITAFESCLQYVVVGTNSGSIFIFDSDCNFIVCNRGLHEGAVTCLRCHQCIVLSGSSTGSLAAYNWLTNNQVIYGGNYTEAITAIAPGLGYAFADGPVYFGTATGSVGKRSRGLLYGYNDHILFSNVSADAPVFEAIWYGYANSVAADTGIELLHRAPPYLFVSWPTSFLLYHERKDAIVARIYKPAADDGTRHKCKLFIDSKHCIISSGSRVYICNRNWDREPFQVLRTFDIDSKRSVSGIAVLGNLVVLAYAPSLPPQNTRSRAGSGSGDGDAEQGEPAQSKPDKDLVYYSDMTLVFHDYQTFAPVDACTIPVPDTPDEASRVALPKSPSLQSLSGLESGNPAFIGLFTSNGNAFDDNMESLPSFATSAGGTERSPCAYIVRSRELHCVRAMRPVERVVWLVRHRNFPRAIQMCKSGGQGAALREVADAYATYLWEERKDYGKAVSVYAEYILPSAPRSYWAKFASRLEKGGHLPLLEKYLPFNNRKVLPASAYNHILNHYLQQRNYRAFHLRISRWPVVYSVSRVIRKIRDLLSGPGMASRVRPEDNPQSGSRDTTRASLAVDDDGSGRNRSVSSSSATAHPYTFGIRDRGISDGGNMHVAGIPSSDPDNGDGPPADDIDYLHMALFKLYEFQSNFVEALRVLIKMKSPNALDYFNAHRLWIHFSLSSMANDVLRRALGTQLDVLGLDSDGEASDTEPERPPSPSYFGKKQRAFSDDDDDSIDGEDDSGDSEGKNADDFYKSDLLEQRRTLLVELLDLDADAVIRILVVHQNDASLHDLVRLLQPHPAYRLKYLTAMIAIDLQRCAPYHHDLISLQLAGIRGDLPRADSISVSPEDLKAQLCTVLEVSTTFDFPVIMEECKQLKLFRALQILINRQSSVPGQSVVSEGSTVPA